MGSTVDFGEQATVHHSGAWAVGLRRARLWCSKWIDRGLNDHCCRSTGSELPSTVAMVVVGGQVL